MTKNNTTNPLWGGRFTKAASELTQQYTSSIDTDKRLYKEDIAGSLAYALALKEAKVISSKDYSKISKGLKAILKEIETGKFKWDKSLEDVHMNIESALVKKAGNSAKKLHTGRSRNDQVSTDLRLHLNTIMQNINTLICNAQESIAEKAKIHAADIMPGFTHMQIAQPVTFGHHLMSWFEMLERDLSRFTDSKERMSVLPLGSAALAGSRFKIDREKLATRLGFNSTSNNSMDAVSDRDFVIEFASNSSILGVHLSRICEELVIWSSSQFNYIQLSDEFCTGSSIMPQKKNPDVAELIRGGSSKAIASLMGLLSLMKNQPLSYNRDMQEDKEFIFTAADYCITSLELFSHMVSGITANTEKMKLDCNLGQITATDLADYLVERDVPFRKAHEVVGRIVKHAESKNLQIFDLSTSELRKFSKVISDDVKSYLDPSDSIKARNSKGGTAPAQVKKQALRALKLIKSRK
jgi:argininosuccinate lyase|tara:strand:- start:237 stop:1637 length:1401 start_codon:yes stop_codon:yes gene_type:complete